MLRDMWAPPFADLANIATAIVGKCIGSYMLLREDRTCTTSEFIGITQWTVCNIHRGPLVRNYYLC